MKLSLPILLTIILFSSCMRSYTLSKEPNFLIYPNEELRLPSLEIIDQGDLLPAYEYYSLGEIEALGRIEVTTREDLINDLQEQANEFPYVDGIILTEVATFEKEVYMFQESPGKFIFLAALEGLVSGGEFDSALGETEWVEMKSLTAYPYVYTANGCFHSVLKSIKKRNGAFDKNAGQLTYSIYGEPITSNIKTDEEWLFTYAHQHLVEEKSVKWNQRINDDGVETRIKKLSNGEKIKVKIYRLADGETVSSIDVKANGEKATILYEYTSGRISGRTLVFENRGSYSETFSYDDMDRIEFIEVTSLGFSEAMYLDYYYHDPQLIYENFGDEIFNLGNSEFITD